MAEGEGRFSATRGALLELQEERRLMQESYDFLDEKRILLATAILSALQQYQRELASFDELYGAARDALKSATTRHGLQGLAVYPAAPGEQTSLTVERDNFLGLTLVKASIAVDTGEPPPAINPSPEANASREQSRRLLERAPALAALARNIGLLSAEYTRTERRAKALENILLPEIESDLGLIEEQLEAIEIEEVLRVRNASERRP